MLRWMLFAPLAVVVVGGLTARRETPLPSPSARPPKTAGAKGGAAPEPAVQTPRSLDAAPVLASSASASAGTNTIVGGRVSPVPPSASPLSTDAAVFARPLFADSARAGMLSMTVAVSGKGATRLRSGIDANNGEINERDNLGGKSEAGYEGADEGKSRVGRNGRRRGAAQEADDTPDMAARWRPPHYAAWNPIPVYGPPLPPERITTMRYAHRLVQDMAAGRLSVMMDERDGEQLRCLERGGVYAWPLPTGGIAARSPRQRDALEGTLEDASQTDLFLASGSRDANKSSAASRMAESPQRQSRTRALRSNSDSQLIAGEPMESSRIENARVEKQSDRLLASRSAPPPRSPTRNPADDPDFDPCVLPPSPGLLRLLTTLASHSTPAHPLRVMSLLRPPYRYGGFVHVGPANPHSLGLAVDIAAYGGHEIRQSEPEQCVSATLALLRDLPPGRYRLGMPKAPQRWETPLALQSLLRRAETASANTSSHTSSARSFKVSSRTLSTASAGNPLAIALPLSDNPLSTAGDDAPKEAETRPAVGGAIAALYGLHCSSAKPIWPFFPPPYSERMEDAGNGDGQAAGGAETVTAGGQGSGGNTRRPPQALKTTSKTVTRFQNEAYAPESGLADGRLRRALQAARERGVEIIALFPDGADHIHIDARQHP